MQITDLHSFPRTQVDSWLGRIPFFREVRAVDEAQLTTLLEHCCLVELAPGETIMRRGQRGHWLCFLLRGTLQVFHDEPHATAPLAEISAGELFGDLALLLKQEQRRATVSAPPGRGATLLACDFRVFGDLADTSRVSLPVKLLFYRLVTHSIRWRLEVNRMARPDHPLVAEMMKLPVVSGKQESVESLAALHRQAAALGELLDRWNVGGGSPIVSV